MSICHTFLGGGVYVKMLMNKVLTNVHVLW